MFHRTAAWEDSDPLRSYRNEEPGNQWPKPDGHTLRSINLLIADAYRASQDAPTPTLALLEGSAIEDRLERMRKRALAALRSLPTDCEHRMSDHESASPFITDVRALVRPVCEPEVA
jgi:hypothetical protein